MSNTARAKGATGAVIAGGLRDTPQILEIGFRSSGAIIRR